MSNAYDFIIYSFIEKILATRESVLLETSAYPWMLGGKLHLQANCMAAIRMNVITCI